MQGCVVCVSGADGVRSVAGQEVTAGGSVVETRAWSGSDMSESAVGGGAGDGMNCGVGA